MNKLKELRKSKNLTQQELATETKIPYRTIQRWENGESNIKPEKAFQLADFFEVSVGSCIKPFFVASRLIQPNCISDVSSLLIIFC